jgi:site-specific recombinase XerD
MSLIPSTPAGDLLPAQSVTAERNPALVYIASLPSKKSRIVQVGALNKIAQIVGGTDAASFPWHHLKYQHVTAIRTALNSRYKPATVNRMLAALRRVLQEAWRLGYMTSDEYRRAADVANVKGESLPVGRALGGGEIGALLSVCVSDGSAAGIRDAAIIAVLYGAGLRRAELAELQLANYTPESGQLIVPGKGRKERTAYLPDGAGAALGGWIALRGDTSGALFCPISQKGALDVGRGITAQAVYAILKKRGKQAGVKGFSPHDLRRTFVSDMLDAGADITTVQKLAGHASPNTTARYDRRGEETKRKAAGLIHVPYVGRG